MKTISFEVKRKSDREMIERIVGRAGMMFGKDYKALDIDMDITATHCNGMPLRLADLLLADDFNFAHDLLGIRKHLNRTTGELENCFVPRFAA